MNYNKSRAGIPLPFERSPCASTNPLLCADGGGGMLGMHMFLSLINDRWKSPVHKGGRYGLAAFWAEHGVLQL